MRDELYAKFGFTAEAAQPLETELGTLLLPLNTLEHGWHVTPAPTKTRQMPDQIEAGPLFTRPAKWPKIPDG